MYDDFIDFCINGLDLENDKIHITFEEMDKNYQGRCVLNCDNSFKIIVSDSLSEKQILNTIAHELTHVYQMSNKLLDYDENYIYWRKKTVKQFDEDSIIDYIRYWFSPWEREARKVARILVKRYENYSKEKQ